MFNLQLSNLGRGALQVSLVLAIAMIVATLSVATIAHTTATRTTASSHQIDPTDPSCTSGSPCIEYVNNGGGPSIEGTSASGNGLVGLTYQSTKSASTHGGLFGGDYSTSGSFNSGVRGISTRGTGVTGSSTSGSGAVGQSSKVNGIVGQTFFLSSSATNAQAGMLGQDLSPNPVSTNVPPATNFTAGVAGTSATGYGVVGTAGETLPGGGGAIEFLNWVGVQGSSPGGVGELGTTKSIGFNLGSIEDGGVGDGVFASGNIGVETIGNVTQASGSECDSCWLSGIGVKATGNIGVMAEGNNGDPFDPGLPALLVTEDDSSAPIIIANSKTNGDVMSLDSSGNMILRGTLTQGSTPLSVRQTAVGSSVLTYSAQQTLPTIEDFGSAQLVNGQAYVRIDQAFSTTMDHTRAYMVFITPNGDSRGVYVSQKTPAGFQVRENQNGHSTLAFDYRIVAQPYNDHRVRLPLARTLLSRRASLLRHIAPPMRGPFRPHYGAGYIPAPPLIR